jgi:hypothetical protein
MKTLITVALISVYGFAWAQTTTTTNPSVPTTTTGSTTTVPTINLPPTSTTQTSPSAAPSQSATADRIREENRMTQERTQQALRQQDGRGVTPRTTTVCIQNDTRCLAEEARNRINQNNGTVRDNPTDLNNRPTY